MTLFASVLKGCGLSHAHAASFLGVRLDTVKAWGTGKTLAPDGAMAELHALADRQEDAAQEAFTIWEEAGEPGVIELGVSADDHEAQSLGWPCVDAHMAVLRRLWELLPLGVKVVVVPRGTTPATARAADLRDSYDE